MSSPFVRFGGWARPLALVLVCGATSATAGPIAPADPSVPLTFDTAAGVSYSLVTQAPWSLLFDERTFSSEEESALALLEGGRNRRDGLALTMRMAGGRSQVDMDDVRRAVAGSHVWSPLGYLRNLPRVLDWSPVVLSEDESVGELRRVSASPDPAHRTPQRVSGRLHYLAPASPQATSLLPARPGSRTGAGGRDELDFDFPANGVAGLADRAQSIPAPPATVLTLLGLAVWYARRTRRSSR